MTVAGALTANGNVTLGNSSSDDVTVTGSLASTINIKTTNSYNIGSSTIGLAGIYFGSSAGAFTTRVIGSAVGASITLTLPATADTLVGKATADTLTNKTLTAPVVTALRVSDGTASRVPYLDANKDMVTSSVTPTELEYVGGTVHVLAASTAGQSITNGTTPVIVFGTESYDTHTAYDNTTGVFTCPTSGDGLYMVLARALYASASFTATNAVRLHIYKNGSVYESFRLEISVTASQQPMVIVSGMVYLVATDTIDIRTNHDESAARSLATSGALYTSLSITRVGSL